MFVTRLDLPARWVAGEPPTAMTLLLEPLEGTGLPVRFETFETAEAARNQEGEIYERLLDIRGRWVGAPSFAVFAEWQVGNTVDEGSFVESRRQLFELRERLLPSFTADWLLQRVDDASRYLVLGLYGDEEGLHLCRDHPEIRLFAQAHPATAYGATDVSGLRYFRIRR